MTGVQIQNVWKSYGSGLSGTDWVLKDLSLSILGGSLTTLVGPNGCGKSTLLNIIAGLLKAERGEVRIENDTDGRIQIGYVWQDYRASLLPWMSVLNNIALPLRLRGQGRADREEEAGRILAEFLPDVSHRGPCYSLSGGQQQLVSLLRCLISGPDIMLLDEPFSALDQTRRWRMSTLVEKIWSLTRPPTLFVSHDIDEAVLLGDTLLLMSNEGGIAGEIKNELPRPRRLEMLTSSEHLRCRNEVIDFMRTSAGQTY